MMKRKRSVPRILSIILLTIAAIGFAFPFYFMIVGAFQESPTNSPSELFPTSGWTVDNFVAIDSRIDLVGSLLNSLIFTAGVLLGTVVFGLLAGYAIARLDFRGRGVIWVLMLLVQMVPFQLLMIPLYVQITRNYGLGDSYMGMILPFLINTTAVFIFVQFFKALPVEIFEAARIDGAGEIRLLTSVAIPLIRPVLVTVVLVTFIGPWNEFLWPFLITKDASLQPLAVSLANYISNVAQSTANPNGAILAGATALAFPVVILFVVFQRFFKATDLGAAVKG
ncbi:MULTISPECIES: carbohydrate ABC transporter permease [unclassified Microbacterium]|jgi:multiple sugar transport system permease protein|uniref:carbohydrate ABC transporter permease n=1 Tax=unclassified Microbacterium TaxID=2609290 RepID=UPI000CFB3C76|nr:MULTISPECIES: carbohydrate ABC transporter permease [unclassified Microbacterium]PQZ60191.1 sugar ABC transporter permease [Microbacterium sp. MYb43]PQZ75824.1 sugar ABC transporter permease [Microbacterium sp. MYb40]PRB23233.1 sugar ABC transporter permease [Microbacterium sp. MYb54]PRB28138.1 sugar ABC transporter permease [Microbacterium sp. MYb50]PRB66188.1 sugar ABC transporter permease [Microbacterium sp. MYb24]